MRGFFAMTKELQDLAGQHDCIAESMMKNLLKDLQTAIQEVKQERRRVIKSLSHACSGLCYTTACIMVCR